ncbi:double zinc ribbon and ankyrin repeat-containing protein 1-like isoform X1 [Haliotis asinina]|uniref:double zinc ribbon and ankyrin repeat-containing protein 1-like isoform X1 n=1 Tax=Haliotis asinina TaxID=109174 RepID=UPI003532016B
MTAGSIIVPTIIPLRAPVPGRSKLSIDSATKIEVRTETRDTDIHYTINGTRPNPFQKMGEKCTLQYRGPFTLPPGKQTVKAVAVSRDGLRESSVVTKVFDVEYVPPPAMEPTDDDLGFQEQWEKEQSKLDLKRAATKLASSSRSAWTDVSSMKQTQQMMADMSVEGSSHRRPGTGPRFLNSRRGNMSERGTVTFDHTGEYGGNDTRRSERRLPDNTTQAMRLQRETDFLKCIYCFADRPSDPYARFCTSCGQPVPPIPQTNRMAPPEPGQMGMCVYCKSMVPFNTETCVVCEGPIPVQNRPQASVKLSDRLICTLCGTANPSNLVLCITCGNRLPTSAQQNAILSGRSAPPIVNPDKRHVTCNKCGRVNNGDARFCDWCGTKPSHPTSAMVCSECHANNHPYSTFCGSCGIKLDAPVRTEYRKNPAGGSGDSKWLPVSFPVATTPKPMTTVACQTVGLFYPSQRGMEKQKEIEEEKAALEKQMRDRRPLLTAISPGRGYWRRQIEHICMHLKAHAQNDAEFRALIGEPKMGKLITSAIQEDGYELSLNLTFALRGNKDPFVGKKLGVSQQGYLSMHTDRDSINSYNMDSEDSGEDTARTTNNKKSTKKAKAKKKNTGPKLSPINSKLMKEIGAHGDGSPSEVQQLVDEGADPSCVNKNGLPALHVASKNRHLDCIPVLVDAGADVNRKGPSTIKGNTALHESVNLGPSGLKVIDTLLDLGADQTIKNERGETPYDLAAKAGYDSIITKFASALGQSQLHKMTKPRTS